ncbi:uncharacterized protein LOC119689494 [Teleopsis dalmanni]|uniref:uncharacterized protein LOC119689494 n=1 Tax=Teleopsis dalmanni TaxID=139649 RepID=UPI0018CDDBBE|nr:uncharacterized protein LOC119689494 [Teleopsis dalmanni]
MADLNSTIQTKKPKKPKRKCKKNSILLMIMNLPPSMTEKEFLEQAGEVPENYDFRFFDADLSLENATSNVQIEIDGKYLHKFLNIYDGYNFVDQKGVTYLSYVACDPPLEQTIENSTTRKNLTNNCTKKKSAVIIPTQQAMEHKSQNSLKDHVLKIGDENTTCGKTVGFVKEDASKFKPKSHYKYNAKGLNTNTTPPTNVSNLGLGAKVQLSQRSATEALRVPTVKDEILKIGDTSPTVNAGPKCGKMVKLVNDDANKVKIKSHKIKNAKGLNKKTSPPTNVSNLGLGAKVQLSQRNATQALRVPMGYKKGAVDQKGQSDVKDHVLKIGNTSSIENAGPKCGKMTRFVKEDANKVKPKCYKNNFNAKGLSENVSPSITVGNKGLGANLQLSQRNDKLQYGKGKKLYNDQKFVKKYGKVMKSAGETLEQSAKQNGKSPNQVKVFNNDGKNEKKTFVGYGNDRIDNPNVVLYSNGEHGFSGFNGDDKKERKRSNIYDGAKNRNVVSKSNLPAGGSVGKNFKFLNGKQLYNNKSKVFENGKKDKQMFVKNYEVGHKYESHESDGTMELRSGKRNVKISKKNYGEQIIGEEK